MCFLKYDGGELVGVCGVYVDDFIIAGKPNGKKLQIEKDKLKRLYKWGNGNLTRLRFAASDICKKKDYSIVMDQQEFTRKLSAAEFNLPNICTK